MDGMTRSPTFFVGTEKQRGILQDFHRQEQQLAEAYAKNKPLCFNARAYQRTHPAKAKMGHKDADATLESPMILGVADGVSQIEEFGIDASELPHQLLSVCEEIGMAQLVPEVQSHSEDAYRGPVPLLREAFESTDTLGSTTVVLAILDNSTKIHGKLHPMIAIITVGDCELLLLRRLQGRASPLVTVFHTEMQRIDGHSQTPLQLARVDARVDPDFNDGISIEVIERGSAVHCISAYEGDVVIMGSDGVFDNLFLDEIADLCNAVLQPKPGRFMPTHEALLGHLAQRIVQECHAKTVPGPGGQRPEAPIGRGGKMDDTSVVVAEVVEWTEAHSKMWTPAKRQWEWQNLITCGHGCNVDDDDDVDEYDDDMLPPGMRTPRSQPPRSYRERKESKENEKRCFIA